jgi:hypothetical protein
LMQMDIMEAFGAYEIEMFRKSDFFSYRLWIRFDCELYVMWWLMQIGANTKSSESANSILQKFGTDTRWRKVC